MINIMALLFSSLILFSPLPASSFDKLFGKITTDHAVIGSMEYIPTISHKNSYLINYENNDENKFPKFTLNLNYSFYHRETSGYGISFSLESEAMLNYNALLLDDNNIELDNESGFVNNSSKTINLQIIDVQPGSYQFILEIIDHKKQMKKITHTIVIP